MSTPESRPAGAPAGSEESARGEGWVLFAGVMILVAGILNVIHGIGAIDDSAFFVQESSYLLFTSLSAWGWIILIIGVIQVLAAFGIWQGELWGRVVGIVSAGLSAIAILLFVNAYPFAAFMVFIIDLLVIYGLAAYGGRPVRI